MPNLAIVKPQPGDEITSTWGTSVADGMNGIQSGIAAVACTAQVRQDFTLTFPRPYVSAPTLLVTAVGGQTNVAGITSLPTATGAIICVFKRDGSVLAAGTVSVEWLAIGVPA